MLSSEDKASVGTRDPTIEPWRRSGYRVLRPHHLRDVNEVAVLRHLISRGRSSRSEIALALGLTQGPITRIAGRLIERGLIRESDERVAGSGPGRPQIPLQVVPRALVILGAHVGVHHVTLGRCGIDGNPIDGTRVDHDGSWAGALTAIETYVTDSEAASGEPVLVGVIIGGQVDSERGVLVQHESLGWRDIAVQRELEDRLDRPVVVEASARAHANADQLFGAAADVQDFLHVYVGNIVEVATVADGQVRLGRDGAAGDVNSWMIADQDGRATTVGAALGDQAVLERARAHKIISDSDDFDAIVELARDDSEENAETSEVARQLLLQRAQGVGQLLSQLDALLAPELIVISSGVLAVDGALEQAAATMRETRLGASVPPVRASRHGTNPLISAAAAAVLNRTLLAALDGRLAPRERAAP